MHTPDFGCVATRGTRGTRSRGESKRNVRVVDERVGRAKTNDPPLPAAIKTGVWIKRASWMETFFCNGRLAGRKENSSTTDRAPARLSALRGPQRALPGTCENNSCLLEACVHGYAPHYNDDVYIRVPHAFMPGPRRVLNGIEGRCLYSERSCMSSRRVVTI